MHSVKRKRLSDIATLKLGQSFRKSVIEDPKSEYFVIQTKDISKDGTLSMDLMRFSTLSEKPKLNVQPGDVLVLSRGWRFTAAYVKDLPGAATAQNMFIILSAKPESGVLPEYLASYLNNPSVQDFLKTMAKGATVQYLKSPDLGSVRIPIPDLKWQQNYVALSQAIEEEKTLLDRLKSLRTEQLKSLLRSL